MAETQNTQANAATSVEQIINDYVAHAGNDETLSLAEDCWIWIAKLQLHLIGTLQTSGEDGVRQEVKAFWDLLSTAAQSIDRNEPADVEYTEAKGAKKLRALSFLPNSVYFAVTGMEDAEGNEVDPYDGHSQDDLKKVLGIFSDTQYFNDQTRALLEKGPAETDSTLSSWLSLNSFLAQSYSFRNTDKVALEMAALVFVRSLEQERPLAVKGASTNQALESWIFAAVIWMKEMASRVASEVYMSKREASFTEKSNGAPPGPLASSKGIRGPELTRKRWKFWKDSLQKMWDLTVEYEHGPEAGSNGKSLAEAGAAAKEGIEAMTSAEELYAPGGRLTDPADKTCCVVL